MRARGNLQPSVYGCRALMLIFALGFPSAGMPQSNDMLSRFERIIIALRDAPPEWRTEFASLSVSQLADAYRAEAGLARQENSPEKFKLFKWANAVDQFADQLLLIQSEIDRGEPVDIALENESSAIVTVGNEKVMLTHPRPEQQNIFEYNLLEKYCQAVPCDELLIHRAIERNETTQAVPPEPQWSFTVDSRFCAYDGIRINFPLATDVPAMRKICSQVFREAENLLEKIRDQINRSVRVEWQYVMLEPMQSEQGQILKLNRAGDAVPLDGPFEYLHDELLKAVIPWLVAKVNDDKAALELQASQLRIR